MDAMAVSICKGMSIKKINTRNIFSISSYFAIFQAIMPIIGYILGSVLETYILIINHWIAFLILLIIGINMLKNINNNTSTDIDFMSMFPLALATSIDALAVGITLAFLSSNIIVSSFLIGIITFSLSSIGVIIGNKFGNKYQKKAQSAGAIILIILSLKILVEHLI